MSNIYRKKDSNDRSLIQPTIRLFEIETFPKPRSANLNPFTPSFPEIKAIHNEPFNHAQFSNSPSKALNLSTSHRPRLASPSCESVNLSIPNSPECLTPCKAWVVIGFFRKAVSISLSIDRFIHQCTCTRVCLHIQLCVYIQIDRWIDRWIDIGIGIDIDIDRSVIPKRGLAAV